MTYPHAEFTLMGLKIAPQDGCRILSRMASLKEHNACAKHKKNMIGFTGSSKIDKLFKNSSVSDGMKKAEIKIVSVLVEHNVPFLVMDHLSDVIKDTFPDSEIARKFSCKRTKSSAIAYNVLGGQFEEKMIQDLKSGLSTFSVIIDESTDRSACVKTRFLCAVDIQGESAQDLFNALNSALEENGLMLSLPVSNVKCERIFSEFNRVKTDDRNKFFNKNVSASIQEGLRDVGSCTNFQPDLTMIKLMDDRTLYKNLKYKGDEI
ncbi:hypothetical protein JTB14_009007 [Gonioctena quinquepunctata]|nr:hypothetical protein JTB14_009007 [Gonioctena quinquepunctata]